MQPKKWSGTARLGWSYHSTYGCYSDTLERSDHR